MILDYVNGGELFFHLKVCRRVCVCVCVCVCVLVTVRSFRTLCDFTQFVM
jgi:hypothetical protein